MSLRTKRGWYGISFRQVLPLLHEALSRPSHVYACLFRLSELHLRGKVFTWDSDFLIYRRHGNKVIPVLMPGMSQIRTSERAF